MLELEVHNVRNLIDAQAATHGVDNRFAEVAPKGVLFGKRLFADVTQRPSYAAGHSKRGIDFSE